MGFLTVFDKVKLYLKYASFPQNVREIYVKIELLLREPDSAWRSGMLALMYKNLAKAFCVGRKNENVYNIRDFNSCKANLIELYFELSREFRRKYLQQICQKN
jgi:hypothetical protein